MKEDRRMRPRHWLYTIPLRLRSLFRWAQADQELDDELRDHLERKTEEYMAQGMTQEEARRRARLDLGGIEQTKEKCRDARRVNWIEDFVQDLRFGFRILRKSRGFTAVAVLTLALGIGANTAIFSVVNGVLLRPLPFANPSQIMLIRERLPGFSLDLPFNAPDFRAFAERQRTFETLAIYSNRYYELSSADAPERIEGALTSVSLFPVLGIEPILGRTFSAAEEQPGHAVAVLSYGLWQRRYGADPNILGRTILLDREPYTVIGVMPKGFDFPLRGERWNRGPAELWVPLAFTPAELQEWGVEYNHTVVGRLKRGVTPAQAQEDAGRVIAEVEKLYPPEYAVIVKGKHMGASVVPYRDRKSTRLNSSHSQISYAVFCLKKKKHSIVAVRAADRAIQQRSDPTQVSAPPPAVLDETHAQPPQPGPHARRPAYGAHAADHHW